MEAQSGLSFALGQNVDVLDVKNKWVNGEVIFIKKDLLYIHYSGWSHRFDEEIPTTSPRVLTQWEPGKPLQINNRVDSYHPLHGGWLEARVIDKQEEVDPQTNEARVTQVKVHYFNYHPKYDRWVDPATEMAIIGAKSKAYGIGKNRSKNKGAQTSLSELAKKILAAKVAYMVEELRKESMAVTDIKGDGNCLFRAMSHQLYGDEEYHAQIRALCMQYIRQEQAFFQDYITEDIEQYAERKERDGIWGDDVEIQALSEIYCRPIEIYATSAKPLRTFHEDNQNNVQPIRLAYVGLCHYNSITPDSRRGRGLIDTPFGQYEEYFLQACRHQSSEAVLSIRRHREAFSSTNPLDFALSEKVEAESRQEDDNLQEYLHEIESSEMSRALAQSENENIMAQIQHSELNEVRYRSEQAMLDEELRRIEERELQIAQELSKESRPVARPGWFGDILAQGFSEQEILFAVEVKGWDGEAVLNFLLDSM